jgi:serine/threonine-protein kinase HipA
LPAVVRWGRPALPGTAAAGGDRPGGSADAHAKNFSLLHDTDGPAVRLAPLYDVLSTIALELTDRTGQPVRPDTHLGQRVAGQTDIRKVTAADLVDEATTWGIRRRSATTVVTETLDRVLAAIPASPGDGRVLAVIRDQAEAICLESSAGSHPGMR